MRGTSLSLPDLARRLPLALGAGLASYLAIRTAGAAGAVVVASSAAFGGALVLWLRSGMATAERAVVSRMATGATLVLPAVATVYLAFEAGGFAIDVPALTAILLAAVLVARCALARDPLRGIGIRVLVPAGALALLALWTLASGRWSGSPARALVEFDRILLYLLALLLFASLGRTPRRLGLAVRAVAAGMVLVATAALASRLTPDLWPIAEIVETRRLSYPLTYSNGLGLLCAVAGVLCLHLTSAEHEPRGVRVAAAAALPVLGAALMLTFSRGGIAAAVLGLAVYAVVGRPRALLTAVLAAGPTTAVAVVGAYDATLLVGTDVLSPAAVVEGHDLARIVIACAVVAAGLRAVLLLADRRLASLRLPDDLRRPVTAAAWAGAALAVVVLALALGAPGYVADRYEEFNDQPPVARGTDVRERLSSSSNQPRRAYWRAAVEGFEADPLKGAGAGTYPLLWLRHRELRSGAVDAHSLYVETLGELGLVGALLVLVAIGSLLVGLLPSRGDRQRATHAVLFAAGVAWAMHAGLDWDWEMPALTLWLFALGGLALGRPVAEAPSRRTGSLPAAAVGLVALALTAVPALLLVSQNRLDASVDAYQDGDCVLAVADARRSADVLGGRPEPYELVGLCLARERRYAAAAAEFDRALARDPDNAGLHASRAAVLAAAGRDPRPDALAARRLNPGALRLADYGGNRTTWRRRGEDAAESLDPSGRW